MTIMRESEHNAVEERIEEIDVSSEMKGSFLEYAYSVIYSRALPDARDGLKPVQRRILFQMEQLGLRPDRPHVKSSRVVGEVMGKLHPHGDQAIYDTLVRLAQGFNQRVPLVDGHGNFGSLDDGPAAPRYTEARMAPAALALTSQLDEDTVTFVPNYDNQFQQPEVLPAAFPNLLINGASGIAVGMATNIPPHNPTEALNAALELLKHPESDTQALMEFLPGPDFPGGGLIEDTEAVRAAYETGRGSFKVRARVSEERVSARKMGLVVTELPYMVGPERVIEKIKDAVSSGKLKGISAVTNLTDRHHGLRLVIDVKAGFNPQAILAQLYKLTPLEESFAINAVALVHGQPKVMSLKDMLEVFLGHRIEVVRRRTEFRLKRASDRLHLVEGLLRAILDIDDVIEIIRSSEDAATAQKRLCKAFDLSDRQAEYILELRLRRLTKFSRIELENEQTQLGDEIASLKAILSSEEALKDAVAADLMATRDLIDSPRRTTLGTEAAMVLPKPSTDNLEIADEPCMVVLGTEGHLARLAADYPLPTQIGTDRCPGSLWKCSVQTTTRGQVALVTDDGIAHRIDVVSLPQVSADPLDLEGALGVQELLGVDKNAVLVFDPKAESGIAIGTANGIVKRVRSEHPEHKESWPVIGLDSTDIVVGAGTCCDNDDLVFVSSNAQLLKTQASNVRPQGPSAGGMAGIKLADNDQAICFSVVSETDSAMVLTVAQQAGTLAGTGYTSSKLTPLHLFPHKGRATMGVRAQRLLKGEDNLGLAWVGNQAPRAATISGTLVALPDVDERRDGSGAPIKKTFDYLGN